MAACQNTTTLSAPHYPNGADPRLPDLERQVLDLLATEDKTEAQFDRLFALVDQIDNAVPASPADIAVKLRRILCPVIGLPAGGRGKTDIASLTQILRFVERQTLALTRADMHAPDAEFFRVFRALDPARQAAFLNQVERQATSADGGAALLSLRDAVHLAESSIQGATTLGTLTLCINALRLAHGRWMKDEYAITNVNALAIVNASTTLILASLGHPDFVDDDDDAESRSIENRLALALNALPEGAIEEEVCRLERLAATMATA